MPEKKEKLTKKQKTDKAILHAAKVLFESKGLDNVTFDDIAEKADVARTTVFNHFSSISELLSAIYSAETEDLLEVCAVSGLEGLELVELLFDKLIEDHVNYPQLATRLLYNKILNGDSRSIERIEQLIDENLGRELVKKSWKPVSGINGDSLTQLLMGAYYGQINHRYIHGLPFIADEMKEEMRSMMRQILR